MYIRNWSITFNVLNLYSFSHKIGYLAHERLIVIHC